MSEKGEKTLAYKLAERVGYIPRADAIDKGNQRIAEALAKQKDEILFQLFVNNPSSIFNSPGLVKIWTDYHQTKGQDTEESKRASRAWTIIRELYRSLEKFDVVPDGFDLKTGPEEIEFDPQKHKEYDERDNIQPGDRVRVIVPGLKYKKSDRYLRCPLVAPIQ